MYFKDPEPKAQAVIIWLHGLGASPQDMEGLSQELGLTLPVRHVYLSAPVREVTLNQGLAMPAWYDIVGLNLEDREDLAGITESSELVHAAIHHELNQGLVSQQVYLAGFSQGAALGLYAGLSFSQSLGGILALSGYLPGQTILNYAQERTLPMFFGMGRFDEVVHPSWTQQAIASIREQGYGNLHERDYPMGHMVCNQEIRDMSAWINAHIGQ